LRDVVGVVEALVDVHGVVHHVGFGEQLNLGLEDVVIAVQLLVLQKLQQREHQVPVQERRHPRRQVVVRHGEQRWRKRSNGLASRDGGVTATTEGPIAATTTSLVACGGQFLKPSIHLKPPTIYQIHTLEFLKSTKMFGFVGFGCNDGFGRWRSGAKASEACGRSVLKIVTAPKTTIIYISVSEIC
jgi:hypothetical protein